MESSLFFQGYSWELIIIRQTLVCVVVVVRACTTIMFPRLLDARLLSWPQILIHDKTQDSGPCWTFTWLTNDVCYTIRAGPQGGSSGRSAFVHVSSSSSWANNKIKVASPFNSLEAPAVHIFLLKTTHTKRMATRDFPLCIDDDTIYDEIRPMRKFIIAPSSERRKDDSTLLLLSRPPHLHFL